MTDDQTKPAAALTAERIKRGSLKVGPADDVAVPGLPPLRAAEAPSTPSSGLEEETRGFLTWRRAGWFGLLYVGALLIFAAVFNAWPVLKP